MTQIQDLLHLLQHVAPSSYAESYDNVGLLVGNAEAEVHGILTTLDITEAVISEALETKCNVIVAHHPIIFQGLKSLTGQNEVERVVLMAIKNDVALIAAHTNLDAVSNGVNATLLAQLGLSDGKILRPKKGLLKRLTYYVPRKNSEKVAQAIWATGAGEIENYREAGFEYQGKGHFTPMKGSNPTAGIVGAHSTEDELAFDLLFHAHQEAMVLAALHSAHPYEVPAYFVSAVDNKHQLVGSGMYADFEQPVGIVEFLQVVKKALNVPCIRHTPIVNATVKRVAVCGGSGSFLIADSIRAKADVYITADVKYHEFFGADGKVTLIDVGHFETETFTRELLSNILKEKFTNIAVRLSKVNTNPVNYFL